MVSIDGVRIQEEAVDLESAGSKDNADVEAMHLEQTDPGAEGVSRDDKNCSGNPDGTDEKDQNDKDKDQERVEMRLQKLLHDNKRRNRKVSFARDSPSTSCSWCEFVLLKSFLAAKHFVYRTCLVCVFVLTKNL